MLRLRASRELEEDFFETHGGGAKFVEIPAALNDGTGEIAADEPSFLGFDFEDRAAVDLLAAVDAANAGDLFQFVLDYGGFEIATSTGDFENDGFGAARSSLEIADGVGGDELSFIDDDDLLAGLLDLGKDVSAENDGVLSGEIFDEVASLVDLLGVEAGGGFVENQDVRIVNDRLREADPLPVAFGELAEELVFYVGDGTALGNVIDTFLQLGSGEAFQLTDEFEVFGGFHLRINGRRLGKIADPLLHFERLLEDVEAGDLRSACRRRHEAGQHAHGRGLPGAVWAEKSDDLSFSDFERDLIDSGGSCVPFGEIFDGNHKLLFNSEIDNRCGRTTLD